MICSTKKFIGVCTVIASLASAGPAFASFPVLNDYSVDFTPPKSVNMGEILTLEAKVQPKNETPYGYNWVLTYPEDFLQFEPAGSTPECKAVEWGYGSVACAITPGEAKTVTVKFKAIGKPCNSTQIAVQQDFGAPDESRSLEHMNKELFFTYNGGKIAGCTGAADMAVKVQEPLKKKSIRNISVESVVQNKGDDAAKDALFRFSFDYKQYAIKNSAVTVNGKHMTPQRGGQRCTSEGDCEMDVFIPLGAVRASDTLTIYMPLRLRRSCQKTQGIVSVFHAEVTNSMPDTSKTNNFGSSRLGVFECPGSK